MKTLSRITIILLAILILPTLAFALETTSLQDYMPSIAKALKVEPRVISIFGEITDESMAKNLAELKELNDRSDKEIEVDITSPGGNVYAGLTFIDAMQRSHAPIKTVCEGYCMSMGAVILAAGTHGRRFATPLSTILLHQVSSQAQGSLAELQNSIAETKRLQDLIDSVLTRSSGLDEKALTVLMNHDNFMSADKAKELHLVDDILK